VARLLRTKREINQYVASVVKAARHHAPNVSKIIEPLADAVVERLDSGDTVKVYERNGEIARTCWVTINSRRCCFSYLYSDEKVVLKDGTTQGDVLFEFDNRTTLNALQRAVDDLWP